MSHMQHESHTSVLLSYVLTSMFKPKNWENPQDNIPYTEVVSFTISLSTASCSIGIKHLYAENGFACFTSFSCLLHSETNFVETWSVITSCIEF